MRLAEGDFEATKNFREQGGSLCNTISHLFTLEERVLTSASTAEDM